MSASSTGSSAIPVCMCIVAIVLMTSLVFYDVSDVLSLDGGLEELIVLTMFAPLFIYFYSQKQKPLSKKIQKRSDSTQPSSVDPSRDFEKKLECCAKSGDVSSAEEMLSEALEKNLLVERSRLTVCFGHLLQACAQAKDAKSAKTSFERMRAAGVKANVVHYGTLISVHAQKSDIAGAEMWFQDCVESGIEPNTVCYNTVLFACSRAGNMAKVKEWLGRIDESGVQKDYITFSTAIHGAIRAQDPACLETWVTQMSSEGFSLYPRTYEDALAMCAQESFTHVAEILFQDIVRNKVELTSRMVHNIARARLYASQYASCKEILESAVKDGLELVPASFVNAAEAANKLGDSLASSLWLSHAEEQLAQSVDNFATIASTALCASKPDCAVSWMQKLQEKGTAEQMSVGYVTMLKCCARLNDDASACTFADQAMKHGVQMTADGYTAAIKACCRASNLQAAESFLDKMIQAGMHQMEDLVACFGHIIGLCARLEDAGRGEFWVRRMAAMGPLSDGCLRLFLDMCDKSPSKAAKLLSKLHVGNIHFTSGENSLTLLKTIIRLGHIKKAEAILGAFSPKFGKSIAIQGHQCIINVYAQEGDFRAAESWLARMTDAGLFADVVSYSTIIHAYAKAGDPLRAEAVLMRMQEAQVEPNTICFNEIINAYAEAGNLLKAKEYFDAIKQKNLTPSTSSYNSILKACVKSGQVAKAEGWYHKMISSGLTEVELDATTFGTLMNASKDSDPMKTEQWLQAARSHGIELNVVHFSTAIHAHAKVGNFERAEALLEQALTDGVELNTMCYNNLISACAEGFQPDRAEGWIVKMRQAGIVPNSFTCYNVVNAWLKVKDFKRARNVILTMEKEGVQPVKEIFSAFAKTVARCGSRADLEDCVMMASQRNCHDNEFFLHAHLSGLVSFHASPDEVETVLRTAFSRGVKLNWHISNVLSRVFPRAKASALIEECGGISEIASKSRARKPTHQRYPTAGEVRNQR